jgi:hypothetical protein
MQTLGGVNVVGLHMKSAGYYASPPTSARVRLQV